MLFCFIGGPILIIIGMSEESKDKKKYLSQDERKLSGSRQTQLVKMRKNKERINSEMNSIFEHIRSVESDFPGNVIILRQMYIKSINKSVKLMQQVNAYSLEQDAKTELRNKHSNLIEQINNKMIGLQVK
jgi:hypothetical protein